MSSVGKDARFITDEVNQADVKGCFMQTELPYIEVASMMEIV